MLKIISILAILGYFAAVLPAKAGGEISFAYFNEAAQKVEIQGKADGGSLAEACAAKKCSCSFLSSGRARELVLPAKQVSIENSSITCPAPKQSSYDSVRIKIPGEKASAPAQLKTSLALQDLLGELKREKVNKIYKYSCHRTFFEGEGVTNNQINCLSSQRLGLIQAVYDYHLFQNDNAGNLGQKFTSSFHDSVCGRPASEFARSSCGNSRPDQRFGLYAEPAGPFQVKVQITSAPEGKDLNIAGGYAAAPDSQGNCRPGFVQAAVWSASPEPITSGSIDGHNPPSNFSGPESNLVNSVLDTTAPENFTVSRQPNMIPCSTSGNCEGATFGGSQIVESVKYRKNKPVICVVPKALLDQNPAAKGTASSPKEEAGNTDAE